MAEYIERKKVIEAVCFGCNEQFFDAPCEPSECSIRQAIMSIPAADVVEVKHGEWVWKSNGYIKRLHCSCCNGEEDWPSTFCPKCGAKMDGERSNEDAE